MFLVIDKLVGKDRNVLKLRPGVTGTNKFKINEEEILVTKDNPQKYNDEIIFPDKVKLNLDYYENQSLWLDIKIIFAAQYLEHHIKWKIKKYGYLHLIWEIMNLNMLQKHLI